MSVKPTVGWIGAGRMGHQLARRLLDAGYDVAVYNRTRAKAESLTEFGATVVDRPVALAGRDIVFSMVSASKDLRQVMLASDGLLTDSSRAPKIVADASTVSIEVSEEVRSAAEARGTGFLATPVSGNPKVIEAGKLTVVASGPHDVFEAARPLLETWGRGVTYAGEGEVARIVKIAHNVLLGTVIQSLSEVTVLAEKAGVRRQDFLSFINDSVMGSVFTEYKTPALVSLDFTPTFTNDLLQKDFDLGLDAARELGVVMPVASVVRNLVAQEVGSGNVEQDFASLLLTIAKGSGLTLSSESRCERRIGRLSMTAVDRSMSEHLFERPSRRPVGQQPIGAPGQAAVDYEHRVNFDRLRNYRLGRAKEALEQSECGAFLLFDFYNVRYTTQTWIGGALGDKMIRYALLIRGQDPILWDFGSAVRHHKLYSDWVPEENYRAGFLGFRGAVAPEGAGLMKDAVSEIVSLLRAAGVADAPLGVDIVEPPFMFELQRQGLTVVDAQQRMLDARVIKSQDEITLLSQAAAMVDGVYQDIADALKPGVRENEIVALANKKLYEYGSDQVEAVNAISGERCNPHPHNFTDRIIRPGDQAFFDVIHSFNGYRTCYYRTFGVGWSTSSQRDAYAKAREWMDAALDAIRPGVGSDEVAAVLPKAEEFGFNNELEAFGLQFAHGLGLGLHERPVISRLNSTRDPVELKTGMVFAMETYCPASDGISAARIEEEVVVTDYGIEVLTRFPAQELFVANSY